MSEVDKLENQRVQMCNKQIAKLQQKKEKIMERYPEDLYGCKGLDKCSDVDDEIRKIEKYIDQTMNYDVDAVQLENMHLQVTIGKMYERLCELGDRYEADLILKRNGVSLTAKKSW